MFRANIYGPLDRGNGYTTTLQSCRWKFSHKKTL